MRDEREPDEGSTETDSKWEDWSSIPFKSKGFQDLRGWQSDFRYEE